MLARATPRRSPRALGKDRSDAVKKAHQRTGKYKAHRRQASMSSRGQWTTDHLSAHLGICVYSLCHRVSP